MQRLWAALSARLAGPRGAAWLAAIAALFSLPALRLPFEMDDHWLRLSLRSGQHASDLMGRFEPSAVALRKAEGNLAWWAHDALHVRFLRPLSSWSGRTAARSSGVLGRTMALEPCLNRDPACRDTCAASVHD